MIKPVEFSILISASVVSLYPKIVEENGGWRPIIEGHAGNHLVFTLCSDLHHDNPHGAQIAANAIASIMKKEIDGLPASITAQIDFSI